MSESASGLPALCLLTAGKSERMGQPKGLLPVGPGRFLDWQLRALAAAGLREIVVVLGFHRERYEAAYPWLVRARAEPIGVLGISVAAALNADPDRGPFSSLGAGLGALRRHWPRGSGCFVLPIDVPCPSAAVWEGLAAGLGDGACGQPVFDTRAGHPVLLSEALVRSVPTQPSDSRLDHLLRGLPLAARRRIPVSDPRILINLNTPESWREFRTVVE